MPDIRIVCEQCGSDRFVASVNTPFAEQVNAIICAVCSHPVRVDEVVIFREGTYISGIYDNFPAGIPRMNDFDI
jgi:hypothetical protein